MFVDVVNKPLLIISIVFLSSEFILFSKYSLKFGKRFQDFVQDKDLLHRRKCSRYFLLKSYRRPDFPVIGHYRSGFVF